jgi:MarR family transcriptional regulator, transcriptional regulator for hemolysin
MDTQSIRREDTARNFGFLVHDVSRMMKLEFDRRGRELGLTRSQWWALRALSVCEGCTQSELADFMDVEKPTLGRIIDRLEDKDWVARRLDTTDRRMKRLYLTDKVQGLMVELRAISAGVRADSIEGLSPEEHEAFMDMLIRIKSNLLSLAESREANPAQIDSETTSRQRAGG